MISKIRSDHGENFENKTFENLREENSFEYKISKVVKKRTNYFLPLKFGLDNTYTSQF